MRVLEDGLASSSGEGAPQGGPCSPVLSNIYLHRFDMLLEDMGLKLVRYADDCDIHVKSRMAADRVMKPCTSFLEVAPKLKVSQERARSAHR
jgi:retron-type reverse transcriptase